MFWLLAAIIAHFFYAGVFIIDRYLLKKGFASPLNYAFWTGIFSIFIIFLAPFGFSVPPVNQIFIALLAGIIWLLAVIAFYTALDRGEASRVVPIVGGFIPIFTLALSFLFLGERLNSKELIAFCLLVSGGVILSLLTTKTRFFSNGKNIHLIKAFIPILGAALFFAVYFVMTKFIFLKQNFVNGLIWIRSGAALGALFMLFFSDFRKAIFKKVEIVQGKTFKFFISGKALGVIAGLLLYLAIFLGSVTLVNALQGVQYLFLLLLAFLLFRKIPSLKEQFNKKVLLQKIFAIVLICLGLAILII